MVDLMPAGLNLSLASSTPSPLFTAAHQRARQSPRRQPPATSLLTLATMFAHRFAEYPSHFPHVHQGVTSAVFNDLQTPFDFVVVGSGYAGSFMARQLASEFPCLRVLLLEAGGMPSYASSVPFANIGDVNTTQWNYLSTSQKYSAQAMNKRQIRLVVGKTLGGDSAIDSGIYTPPNLADFHRWSYLYKLNGWGYVEMKPYIFEVQPKQVDANGNDLKKHNRALRDVAEEAVLRRIRRPLRGESILDPIKAAWLKGSKSMNMSAGDGEKQAMYYDGGFFLPQTMVKDGHKMNAASQFLKDKPENLVVILHSKVDGLLYTPDGRRAVGLTFRDTLNNVTYHVNSNREILLAAGTIGTAAILMQSGIGPKDVLSSQNIPVLLDLPIGARLNDRVKVPLYVKVNGNIMRSMHQQINNLDKFMAFLKDGTGIMSNTSVIGCALLRTGTVRSPDLLLELRPTALMGVEQFLQEHNYKKDMMEKMDPRHESLARRGALEISVTLLRPFSQGTMWLWRRQNDTFTPRMNPSYLADSRDVDSLVAGIGKVEHLLQNEYFRAMGAQLIYPSFKNCPSPIQPIGRKYWECYVRHVATSGGHLSGTVPLGSAVDERLNVKGLKGVRVIDQSLFPEPASGGISSTILAVANRAYRITRNDNRLRCEVKK